MFLARLGQSWVGDDSLLSAIIKECEAEGFRVIGPQEILKGFLAPEGVYGNINPEQKLLWMPNVVSRSYKN